MSKLTASQIAALDAASITTYKTATQIGVAGVTMASLGRAKLVDVHWPITTGKVGTATPSYRLNQRGYRALLATQL